MNYVERVLDGVHNVLNLNAATLSGAIDIVVVPQPDGTLKSTPFHVRFGKLHLLNSSEKVVTMYVNDEIVDIQLKLGNAGEAFFVEETEDFVSPSQITSPIGSPPTSPGIFKRTTEMVGGKPVVKEVQTHIDSKMEQMIIEDAQLQPQQVTVIHEDKKEKQEQKAKQKIVIDHEDHKTVLPATLPLPVNAPLTSTHPNQQSSSPVDSVTNNPRVRSESLPSYMLDTALEEMYNENPEAPTKDGKAEQESYFTWRWGGFPKYRGGKTLDQPDSDSETLAKDSAVSSKEAPPVAGWKSLFRIFKGVEPQYLVRDEEIEAAIEASDTPEALPVTDKNNEEQQPLSTSLTLSQPLQLLESSSLTTTPIFVPEEEEDSDSSSDSAEYDDASSENDDPTLQFDMHFEKSKKTPEITHTSSPSTDNDKRDKPIPHTITEQITTTTIPSNDNKKKEHLIPRLPLRSSTDGFDVIKDPPTSPKKYQSDKEESVEKKNEPLLTFEELPEIKIEISKCGHIIGPNVNDEVAKQKIFQENLVRYEDICKDPEVILDPNILFKIRDKIYPWSVVGPLMVSAVVFKKPLDPKAVEKLTNKYNEKMKIQAKKGWSYWFWGSKSVPSTPKDRTPEVPPSPKPDVRELPSNQKILQKVIKKSLRPTGDQLKVLKLKEGANSVRFSVTSKLQGTREVHGTIYLWKQDTKVVISDIDGTITKSDVMGHILPMLGRDWSHSGIAELYTNIKKNNYQILYLTARPIGQAGITRGYITTLKQGEKTLPQGPIFMSPNRLLSSFHQEVVARRPDEFKIACLKDIQSLFTNNEQVFYAGFGNRPTDFLSYRAVHVPLGKIFIINYKGEINVVKSTSYRKTYSTLNELVHEMFPPLFETVKPTTLRSSEQWNNWNYWKPPLPNIEEDLKQQQAVVQSKEKK